ncbi:hypothetical protein KCV87_15780 [Actinosynnema pretiosum subsp. pretiosum]|uniref:Protein kinase domain-containing protein n=1 Tax=Actinosynnema pretiosum subsp. pretiosum TaxID=103721 RepID=A0AA45LCJ2_9PSEU|nr:hypothetical protein APASM_0910 [Actinosynnema pretiosum subsp. pretiosum]QUF07356.1 hypothetical protein KCV87_15780 [Actinosynnema pretiosum subsp. pretiosum]
MENPVDGVGVSVDLADLGTPGAKLGSGGEAAVHAMPGFRLPDVKGELVFKRYRNASDHPDALRRVVAARTGLDDEARARLDAITAWPVRVVLSGGKAVGVLMPRIPDPFFDVVTRSTGEEHKLREVQHLFVDESRTFRSGRPVPTAEQRLRVCLDFASALAFLHDRLKFVFGDINAKNEVFRLDARPMVLFLDCDAARPVGTVAATRQLNAEDWIPPEQGVLNLATDRYKLGLFVLRCLTPGHFSSVKANPDNAAGVLDAEGMDLLRRALGADQAARPSSGDWVRHLRHVLGEAVDRPVLGEVLLDRTFTLTGQPVVVRWEAREARHVELTSGPRTVRVDGRPGRGSTSLRPAESGLIGVRALNDLGEDVRQVGPVTVLPLPGVDRIPVPLPEFDWPFPEHGQLRVPTLPALPNLAFPVPAPPVLSGHRVVPLPPVPSPSAAAFPLDLRAMVSDSPALDLQTGAQNSERKDR